MNAEQLTYRVVYRQEFHEQRMADEWRALWSHVSPAVVHRIESFIARRLGKSWFNVFVLPPGDGSWQAWLALADRLYGQGDPLAEIIFEEHAKAKGTGDGH